MNVATSANDFIQASRLLRIETPLGTDALLMESFSGREAVNELFNFTAVVRAKREDITPQDLIGKLVDVSLDRGDEGPRRNWNALVVGITEEPRLTRALRQYVLTLRPELWLLSQRSDCRIWQNKTTVEIAETLLSEHGLKAPDTSGVINTPPPQEYSVQWNETDLDFLLRRFEEDGLHYWVRQKDGQTLVIADSAVGWDDALDGGNGQTRYAAGSSDRDHIHTWTRYFNFVPGKRGGRDWNFETPKVPPGGESVSLVKLPRNSEYELYEYPSRALDDGASQRSSKLRMQSVEADHEQIKGGSTARTLMPGAKVTPYDVAHPEHAFETSVIVSIEHFARDTTYEAGSEHPIYTNTFEALPARLPATPHRNTARPRIDGTQIALIACPEGEEIHTDSYGRVKLWFPWDRRAKKDGSDTKWVRVAQPWAGGTWGAQTIPRKDMEAVVSFEHGDPDRPLVTALVPNPVNNTPYGLPGHKTKSVLRSNTHKGTGYNEMSFEDERGQENFFLHAQKDMATKVLNDATTRVDASQVQSIGANRAVEVAQNQKHEVGGSMSTTVGAVGGMATTALSAATAGLAAQTAGLLQQAMGAAVSAMGAAAQGASDGGAGRSAQAASAAMGGGGGGGGSGGGGGGASAAMQAAQSAAQLASGFTSLVGSGAVGGLLAGAVDQARNGINNAARSDMMANGAASMTGAGTQMAGLVGQMMGGAGGIMNTTVSRFQNSTTGLATTEQVGISKVVNVGQVSRENVGHSKKVTIGEELVIEVGKSLFIMKKDGTVIIKGVSFHFEASGPFQQIGKIIDLN
ncbi:type VI secretion system Vgr family protein [Xanthobacteraceae bacterium A53D]